MKNFEAGNTNGFNSTVTTNKFCSGTLCTPE